MSDNDMSKSVGTEILVELERNRELLDIYRSLPDGAGEFGAIFIGQDIAQAEKALAENDIVAILKAYVKLKDNE